MVVGGLWIGENDRCVVRDILVVDSLVLGGFGVWCVVGVGWLVVVGGRWDGWWVVGGWW